MFVELDGSRRKKKRSAVVNGGNFSLLFIQAPTRASIAWQVPFLLTSGECIFFCANEGVRSEIHSPNPFRGLGLTLEAMDVSIPGSPNPGWEFHGKPQEVFTSVFR